LNGILGFTSLLKLNNISEEEKKSYLQVIEDSGKHLLTIIDDLIEVSRIETGQFELRKEIFNLNKLLDELSGFFENNEKYKDLPVVLNLTLALNRKESLIYSDRVRLKQVLYNLLSNAYKFTDEGKIEFGYEIIGPNIRFFVKDTGTGIPEEWHESIFERFRQYKNSKERTAGGNGLGLTICKGIISEMNGRIWVDSKPGRGSDFYFEFLFEKADDPVNSEKPEEIEFNYKFSNKTILVAEDEPSNYTLIKNILKNTGVKLFHAKNGTEVLKMMRTKNSIDLILMDIKMPELDGIGAVKALRENKIKLPVIAQTAYVLSDDRKKCLQAGCDDYVSKPIQPRELLQKIHNFLT
jgi:CheY-like chemotaxis protein